MDDGAREDGRERLECLLSFWLCLPQWTPQAVALLKRQYREAERGERQRRRKREEVWGKAGEDVPQSACMSTAATMCEYGRI